MEALAEYDAYHYSSTWNRVVGIEYLLELADYSHRHRIYWTESLTGEVKLWAESEYVGGAVIMMFLKDKYGEAIHNELLRKEYQDVFSGSRELDRQVFQEFKDWFDGKEEIVTWERCHKSY